jgi:predicted AlkP superfamily phosphohydrolase/phosphomutase
MAAARRLSILLLVAMAGAQDQGRVIVLGVDGLDPGLTRAFLEAGELPAIAALSALGSFGPLATSNPAQSPVAWTSLVSGQPPSRTGIRDFLARGISGDSVIPENGLVRVERARVARGPVRILLSGLALLLGALVWWILRRRPRLALILGTATLSGLLLLVREIPGEIPVPRNRRGVPALWETLDREGVVVTSLFAPCAFPAPELAHGRLLAGLGVPDLLGTHGACCLFRGEPVPDRVRLTPMGGREVALRGDGLARRFEGVELLGPAHPRLGERLSLDFVLEHGSLGWSLQSREPAVPLEEGAFTPFVPVRFPWSFVFPDLRGLVRWRLLRGGDRPVLYQEPLQIDPRFQVPWARITTPIGFGADLARSGLFETAGWATATNPYQDGLVDDATLIDDVRDVRERQESMILETLRAGAFRVHFSVLSTPDRVQHVFWRDRDPEHPAHDPAALARHGDRILESYRDVDRFIGRIVREVLQPEDLLLVVSDHGFAPFRYAVNLNRWLLEAGYLAAQANGPRSLERHIGRPIGHVDWDRTRAYSLGLGQIWLNLAGREPAGIVPLAEAEALLEEIRAGLLGLEHEGRAIVRSAVTARELGIPDGDPSGPDLVVGFAPGYRVSWDSCLLGLDEPVIFPNRSRWSGDHCSVDPEAVPGLVLSNRSLRIEGASLLDLYPTVRAALGLEPDPDLPGRSWIEAGR